MNILTAVPGSGLWLLARDGRTAQECRNQAKAAGIEPERIVPENLLPKREHLSRATVADLLLDIALCNAHTSVSDALWAGILVLTCPGDLFDQRIAASDCAAAGRPDLIVDNFEDYAATATGPAQYPTRIRISKDKLASARKRPPLLDVPRFAHKMEATIEYLVDPKGFAACR